MSESAKIGRSKRRASSASYNNGKRWSVNKNKRIAKANKQRQKDARKRELREAGMMANRGESRRIQRVGRQPKLDKDGNPRAMDPKKAMERELVRSHLRRGTWKGDRKGDLSPGKLKV